MMPDYIVHLLALVKFTDGVQMKICNRTWWMHPHEVASMDLRLPNRWLNTSLIMGLMVWFSSMVRWDTQMPMNWWGSPWWRQSLQYTTTSSPHHLSPPLPSRTVFFYEELRLSRPCHLSLPPCSHSGCGCRQHQQGTKVGLYMVERAANIKWANLLQAAFLRALQIVYTRYSARHLCYLH